MNITIPTDWKKVVSNKKTIRLNETNQNALANILERLFYQDYKRKISTEASRDFSKKVAG